MNRYAYTLYTLMALGLSTPGQTAEVEVKMLNKGTEGTMVFEPMLVHVQSGDTVHFKATDKGHNVVSLAGMLPDGVPSFKSKLGQDFKVTFDKTGIYGYSCPPHFPMGMVGAVVVGQAGNLETAKAATAKMPAKAKARFEKIFAGIK